MNEIPLASDATLLSERGRYSTVAMVFHWTIALMIIGLIVFGILMTNPNTPNRFMIYQLHKSFGIMVLILSVLRLFWRLRHKPPALPSHMKPWERVAARFTHIAFYVIMIGMPLLGWAMVTASPLPIPTKLFWTVPWPDLPFIPESKDLEALLKGLHRNIGKLTIVLIALHIGAALKHHFIGKDHVLASMLPFVKPRS